MGASTYLDIVEAENARDAFIKATEDARHLEGHAGYTGTIAEKYDQVIIDPEKDGKDVSGWTRGDFADYAQNLINEGDGRIEDKWGPSGCIDTRDGAFILFGWASS